MLRVEMKSTNLVPGDKGSLVAYSDSTMEVVILCYVQPPNPPELSGCDQCGSFRIQSGVEFNFSTNKELFEKNHGYLQITIENSSGEQWLHKINFGGRTLIA